MKKKMVDTGELPDDIAMEIKSPCGTMRLKNILYQNDYDRNILLPEQVKAIWRFMCQSQ